MELHKYKPLSFGVCIIAPDCNYGNILTTVRTIRNNHPGVPFICVVPKGTATVVVDEIKKICPIFRSAKDTITSMMNTSIKKGHKEWNLLVMEGACVKMDIDKKYSYFVEKEEDVLFPIILELDRKGKPCVVLDRFPESTLNGIFINQKTFKNVGDFEDCPIIVSKLMWAASAIAKGCVFKGVMGAKLL